MRKVEVIHEATGHSREGQLLSEPEIGGRMRMLLDSQTDKARVWTTSVIKATRVEGTSLDGDVLIVTTENSVYDVYCLCVCKGFEASAQIRTGHDEAIVLRGKIAALRAELDKQREATNEWFEAYTIASQNRGVMEKCSGCRETRPCACDMFARGQALIKGAK